jgi:hypothetical protein
MRMINCFLGRVEMWSFDIGDGQIIKPVIKPVFLVSISFNLLLSIISRQKSILLLCKKKNSNSES